jgi:predicted permease
VSGLVPIGSTRRASPAAAFAGAARTTAVQRSWARQGLVLSEVGLSIVVLIGAALMVQTFLTLRPTQPGFDVGGKQMLIVRLPGRSGAESARFYGRLFDRLARTPGIRRAEGTRVLPMVFGNARILPVTFGDATASTNINLITPGYLELMKIPLRAGRAFTALDTSASMPVAIVNETLARRIRPDGQVLGERISTRDPVDANAPLTERVIVGVAGDVRTARYDTQPRREAYIPYAQEPTSTLVVVAEAEGGAEHAVGLAMREAVRALDQTLVLEEPRSMAAELSRTVQHWRFQAWLLGAFAGLAILLAAIGLMTTIGWWVHQRTRELGLRVALGATRGRVVRLVLRQGLTLAGLGIAAGSLAAMGLTGYLESSLYGVTPLDPKTFVGCAAGMLLVAVAAVLAPVRRAISVDPVVALRAE